MDNNGDEKIKKVGRINRVVSAYMSTFTSNIILLTKPPMSKKC